MKPEPPRTRPARERPAASAWALPRRACVVCGLLVAACGVGGCVPAARPFAGPPAVSADGRPLLRSASAGGVLVADDRSPLPDVPVPLRFVLVPSRSAASPSAGPGRARDVTHVYQGRAGYDRLSWFFAERLAAHGWRPDPSGPASGPIRAYRKGPEQLHLSLSEARGVATVSVRITGLSQPSG